MQAKAEAQDSGDDDAERFVGPANGNTLDAATIAKQLAQTQRQMSEIDAALAETEYVKAAGETVPKYIPLTDPQARVTPNKEGGFAPNYTPLATVDVQGLRILSLGDLQEQSLEVVVVPPGLLPFAGDAAF